MNLQYEIELAYADLNLNQSISENKMLSSRYVLCKMNGNRAEMPAT